MVGPVLSTVNGMLGAAAGAVLPARSVAVPAAIEMRSVPSPVMLDSVTVRVVPVPATPIDAVAGPVLAPLTENRGAGTSAMASLNVAVSVNVVPCLTIPAGAYVRAAVGDVLSTLKVAPLVGVAVIRFPATSFPAPIVTVAVASTPACTVYRY